MSYDVLTWEGRDGEAKAAAFERRDAALGRFVVEVKAALKAEDTSVLLRERHGRTVRTMARLEVGAL